MTLIDTSQYLTLSILGRGNHPVLKVQCLESRQLFALKKIVRESFEHHMSDLQELMVLSSLNHPNIVKVCGFETKQMLNKVSNKEAYILYILLELLEGNLYQEILERKSQMRYYSVEEMKKIVLQLLDIMAYLHEKGIAHRDLKPENLLLGADGRLVLSDFNDSFKASEICSSAKTIVGSPYYMAPELRRAFVDGEELSEDKYDVFKADVWALGMTILEFATMSIGDSKNNNEKLESVKKRYGLQFKDFIGKMLEINFKKRVSVQELKKLFEEEEILSDKRQEEKIEFSCEKLKEHGISNELFELFKDKNMNRDNRRKMLRLLEKVCEMEEENKKLKQKMVEFKRERNDQKIEKTVHKELKEKSLLRRLTSIFCTPA